MLKNFVRIASVLAATTLLMTLPFTPLVAPIVADGPHQAEPPLPNCIAVVGDSLAAGSLVVQLPGVGFVTILTRPLAVVIDDWLSETRYADVPVMNFAVPAAYLSADGLRPYRLNDDYQALVEARCDVMVMTAWNNDLQVQRDNPTEAYVNDIELLIAQLRLWNPEMRALLWTHFWGAPQRFADGYGGGLTYNNSQAHRAALLAACGPDGDLGEMGGVACVDLDAVFEGDPIYNVVIGNMNRGYFNALLYGGLTQDERGLVDFFFGQGGDPQAVGDGVHFTEFGKRTLAQTVLAFLDAPPAPSQAIGARD